MTQPKINKKIRQLATGAAIVVGSVVFYNYFGFFIPCPVYTVTGLYCPGCGTMRALSELFHLHFWQAVSYNVFTVFLLPLMAVLTLQDIWASLKNKPPAYAKYQMYIVIPVIVLAFVFTVLRNLPWFSFLAP